MVLYRNLGLVGAEEEAVKRLWCWAFHRRKHWVDYHYAAISSRGMVCNKCGEHWEEEP